MTTTDIALLVLEDGTVSRDMPGARAVARSVRSCSRRA